jgi:hypothetical protein
MSAEVVGARVYPEENGYLDAGKINRPATYGRATAERVLGTRAGWWQVAAPDGSIGALNPGIHQIAEHEDGTITVTPSLDFSKRREGAWHGWLTRGVFRSV